MEGKPIVPQSFSVALMEWNNDFWKGKKFIRIKFYTGKDYQDVILWPEDANCLMDQLRENLEGVDLSYNMLQAYEDAMKGKEKGL